MGECCRTDAGVWPGGVLPDGVFQMSIRLRNLSRRQIQFANCLRKDIGDRFCALSSFDSANSTLLGILVERIAVLEFYECSLKI